MVKIILVRHAETDWNQSMRIQGGSSNTPLNERGGKQAEGLALRLKPERLKAIYSSPLQRALDTARVISGYHQLEVEIEPSLKEIEVGELEGVSVAEMGKRLSQLLTANGPGGALSRIPGGESLPEVQQRAWGTIQLLASKHPEGVLVVVTHFFVILTIICAVLKLPLSQISSFKLGTGSISAVALDEKATRLVLFNESCYQPGS